ncbi:zinc-dependent alcohol dehydrogenase family protein [Terriglobus aquaticus]|uniref:Zinc-dependent alcohol dehydrogenase family protein n=1 Tax=Terriglobus aquaticus TaxID=940139 RepID=A0ABW9KLH9_9BACT|nr:NAD(P)-dependent alcohol dehydrogenase [Terriglobus aquaticus]
MRAQALQLTGDFSIDALEYRELDVPEPGEGEVLVRISAASLNYRDLMVVRGHYNPRVQKPLTLCSDGAGEVVSVGKDVTTFQEGDRVVASFFLDWNDGPLQRNKPWPSALGEAQQGVLTTYRVLPTRALVRLPDQFTYEEGSTFPCAGVTAWNALTQFQPVDADSTVLLQGTGGVSIFGLQIARAFGARTIITSSSEDKLARARQLGASEVVNYRNTPEWDRAVSELTQKRGVTHILEVGGAGTLPLSLRAAAPGGLVAVIGILSGTEQPLSLLPLLMHSLQVQGIYVGSTAMLRDLVQFYADHQLKPVVDQVFPFAQAQDALRAMDKAGHFGKLVITLDDASN